MDLREYEQSKFAIAEILRSASAFLPDQKDELRVRLQDLFSRLAEDRFNLVVLGRFNRGKSSLMNAILRTDRLPTGIVPLTSVITTVGYGSKERVVLKYDNRILDREISIEALPQHITQQGNPGNVQGIKTAEVQLPAEILRRGFYFVDTPGLGSIIVENTFTTETFLPEADALILVTSYESPLSEDEVRFFKAASSGRRIFVVLNKHDTVSPEQRNAALGYVREQLDILFGDNIPPIFSVSSTDGLNAKLSQDQALLETSGIPELEERLLDFLLTEKSSEFLRLMCHRARQFFKELSNEAAVENLIAQIDALGGEFSDETLVGSTRAAAPAGDFPNLHRLQSCEICSQVADRLWNFLCKYQYEIIISRDEQQRLANSGGLCPFHTWQLWPISSPYGICAGHAPLFDRLAIALRDYALAPRPTQVLTQLRRLLPDEHDCTLCRVRSNAEQDAIDAITEKLKRDKMRTLNTLSAICVPHFVMLASTVQNEDLLRTMLQRQATVLERYAEDMKRYAIKHAGVRQYLASEEEKTAAERGLMLVAGRRQVNFVSKTADRRR